MGPQVVCRLLGWHKSVSTAYLFRGRFQWDAAGTHSLPVLWIFGAPHDMRNAGIMEQEADLNVFQATNPGR
jgi:hypothetical protein